MCQHFTERSAQRPGRVRGKGRMNGQEDGGVILHLGKQAEALIGPWFGEHIKLNMEDALFSKQIPSVG